MPRRVEFVICSGPEWKYSCTKNMIAFARQYSSSSFARSNIWRKVNKRMILILITKCRISPFRCANYLHHHFVAQVIFTHGFIFLQYCTSVQTAYATPTCTLTFLSLVWLTESRRVVAMNTWCRTWWQTDVHGDEIYPYIYLECSN